MNRNLREIYESIKNEIDARLEEFAALGREGEDLAIFRELCFCTCTPQTSAHKAWNAMCELGTKIADVPVPDLAAVLHKNGVRFHNNKARYIGTNREAFYPQTREKLAVALDGLTGTAARNLLADAVAGWGLKEASHFLRNIGHGDALCILDRHILRQLVLYGVLDDAGQSLTRKFYLEIESKMTDFAFKQEVPLPALDLVFWYIETGELFK